MTSISIKAVIFDLDGTIASFNLDYKALRGEVRSYLLQVGVPSSVLSVNENIFGMLTKTAIYVKNTGKSSGTMDEIRNGAWAIAEKSSAHCAVAVLYVIIICISLPQPGRYG